MRRLGLTSLKDFGLGKSSLEEKVRELETNHILILCSYLDFIDLMTIIYNGHVEDENLSKMEPVMFLAVCGEFPFMLSQNCLHE